MSDKIEDTEKFVMYRCYNCKRYGKGVTLYNAVNMDNKKIKVCQHCVPNFRRPK